MIDFDESLIPARVMLDTTVLIRALESHPSDPRAPICRALFEFLLRTHRRVLIAAPSVTELERPTVARAPIPAVRDVEIVALDQVAAREAAKALSVEDLKRAVAGGATRGRVTFDALIVGCAIRAKADVLVTLDSGMVITFGSVVRVREPIAFQGAQGMLLQPRTPGSPKDG